MNAVERLKQCVVEIRQDRATGTGFAWDVDLVVTAAHVAHDGPLEVRLPNGEVRTARLRFSDRSRDIALLEVPGLGLAPVTRRDPAELRPGHTLFAIGHPLGVRHAMSSGILHGVGPLPDGFPVPPRLRRLAWVQADLRLAPGNSGGPIADDEGRVVGVCTMIVSGLALAVPITDVETALRARAA
jgi:serine protease Do